MVNILYWKCLKSVGNTSANALERLLHLRFLYISFRFVSNALPQTSQTKLSLAAVLSAALAGTSEVLLAGALAGGLTRHLIIANHGNQASLLSVLRVNKLITRFVFFFCAVELSFA